MPTHQSKIEELQQRLAKTLELGGSKKIVTQHKANRLTARERIEKLTDKDSFIERGQLATSDLSEAKDSTPADGKITGFGKINNQRVCITAEDVTVKAGAGGRVGGKKEYHLHDYARKKGIPCIHLGDGGGARIPDIMGATGMMSFTVPTHLPPRSREVPLISAIMGECYGSPTWRASVSDIVIQVKGCIMAVAGPPIVTALTNEKITAEELGGWEMHAKTTGLVDLFAEDENHCLDLIKSTLSYFPDNFRNLPKSYQPQEPTNPNKDILKVIPEDARLTYDMHKLLEHIVDKDSLLELKPYFDGSLITTLARIDGKVVGILANNPKVMAGAMGPGACEKAVSFIALCDSFHIPLIFMHDTPGFYVNKAAEERKMPVKIMNFIQALQYSTVPKISLIVRKSYGMAHCNMLGANMGADTVMAFPTAEVSFMSPHVAAEIMLKHQLKDAENKEEIKANFLKEMNQINAPWEAAGENLIDRIIDPRETRVELIEALDIARGNKNGGMSKRKMASWIKM